MPRWLALGGGDGSDGVHLALKEMDATERHAELAYSTAGQLTLNITHNHATCDWRCPSNKVRACSHTRTTFSTFPSHLLSPNGESLLGWRICMPKPAVKHLVSVPTFLFASPFVNGALFYAATTTSNLNVLQSSHPNIDITPFKVVPIGTSAG